MATRRVLTVGACAYVEWDKPGIADRSLLESEPKLPWGRWHTSSVGAHDGLEKDEPDVRSTDTFRELAMAEGPADRPQPLPPDEPGSRGEVYAELRQRVEGGWEPRSFEVPRAELSRFAPERAALPATSLDAAAEYLAQHRTERPWLTAADAASPETRRIFAAMDAGGGHGHIRHEGWVSEEASMRRVTYREDPAQLDYAKRDAGIDGLRQTDQPHQCASTTSRITDPDAFATAFARSVEHPKVREALDMAFDPRRMPRDVAVPIADLLGPNGHRYCTGWQLEPVNGSMKTAQTNRDSWLAARAQGREPDVPEPRVQPVPTFEGGEIAFFFRRNYVEKRYGIVTMFPRPAVDDQPGLTEGDG